MVKGQGTEVSVGSRSRSRRTILYLCWGVFLTAAAAFLGILPSFHMAAVKSNLFLLNRA